MAINFYQERSVVRPVIHFIMRVFVVIAIARFFVYGYGYGVIQTGQSMDPVIASGETVIVDRIKYHFREPERFDVIAYTIRGDVDGPPDEELRIGIRRVIGLPGESVKIADGYVHINGERLENERGLAQVTLAGIAAEEIRLGDDEFFVLGDNREASEDSRFAEVGNIRRRNVIGRVWFKSRPIGSSGRIR